MSSSELSPQDLVIRIALVKSDSPNGSELNPSVWRRIKLSAHLKLDVLHDKVLIPLMGWTRNYHTYYFSARGKKWLCQNTSAPDLMHSGFISPESVSDPQDATLGDLLKKVGDKILYTYDLGDCWYHTIELEEVIGKRNADGACVVMDGEMKCPDEDGEGCNTYQTNVLDLVLKMRNDPHDNATARQLARNCFERHNAVNVRGRFDPNEFSVEDTQSAVDKAFMSRASAMTGTKQFTSSQSMFGAGFGSFCPTRAGQRVLKTEVEDDRGGDGFHLNMSETINLKPDDKDHTACICGNPLNLQVCSGCRVIFYCSVDCQRKDWKREGGHKKMCKKEKATKILCDKEEEDWTNNKPASLEITGEVSPLVKVGDKLRFKIGDVVECAVGENMYATGVIVDANYREFHWPASMPSAPYQIKLSDDNAPSVLSRPPARDDVPLPGMERSARLIFAVWDDDYQIRKLPESEKMSPGIAKIQMDIVD